MTTNFVSSLSFVAVFGSGIRDPGSGMGKNQDPGSGINIPDPQHCGPAIRFCAQLCLRLRYLTIWTWLQPNQNHFFLEKAKNILFMSTMDFIRGRTDDDQREKPALLKFYDFTMGSYLLSFKFFSYFIVFLTIFVIHKYFF